MEQKRIFGRIFLPDDPENRIEAWLTLGDNNIQIEASFSANRIESWPLILGEFNGMDRATFLRCHSSGGIAVGAGGAYTKLYAEYCISGGHFFKLSDLLFQGVTLFSPALAEWIVEKEFVKELKDYTYKIPDFEEIANVNLDNDISLRIRSAYSIKSSAREVHAKHICSITLDAKGPIDLQMFIDTWRHLRKLILFITHKNPRYDRIVLRADKKKQYELLNVRGNSNDKRFAQGLDIDYRHLRDTFPQVIDNWFRHKKLYAAIDLVLEKLVNTEMSFQGFFLNVCIALETFHESFGEADKSAIKKREKDRKTIAALITDEELKSWFKEQSAYWKNPWLVERLHTFKDTIEAIKGSALKKYDYDSLISRIVKTRNDIAHTGEYLKRFNDIELFIAAKIIEFTIRVEILKLFGVDVNQGGDDSIIKNAHSGIDSLAYINKLD